MQKQRQEHTAPEQKPVIVPASARCADGSGSADVAGYAIHTGEARSTEDVTVRHGTAPILERGEADDEEDAVEWLSETTASSGGAPD
jgi:hypothetical protein